MRAQIIMDMSTRSAGDGEAVSFDSSTQSAAITAVGTTKVRVSCTTDGFIAIGASPTAVVGTGFHMPAGTIEYFDCLVGEKVAAIKVSSAGTMYVKPVL